MTPTESREIIVEIRHKGHSMRLERVQQWRAGFELSYDGFVDDKNTQKNMKAEDAIRWLSTFLHDES